METRASTKVRDVANVILDVRGISKHFVQQQSTGEHHELLVLDGISFSVEKGSFTSILGPSGCGKSTVLNILAGLEGAEEGTIRYDPKDARIAYVFQTPRLLPWSKVIDNIRFVHSRKNPRAQVDAIALRYLEMVGLHDWAYVYPHQLSGGMQQRIGIARALSLEPDLLLMDEPFSHLDEITAKKMRSDLTQIWEKTNTTILFVTHDMSEAVFLSDRVIFLTRKPARVDREVKIDLARPRRYDDPEYFELEVKLTKDFEIAEEEFAGKIKEAQAPPKSVGRELSPL